jgi:hypothetical protein
MARGIAILTCKLLLLLLFKQLLLLFKQLLLLLLLLLRDQREGRTRLLHLPAAAASIKRICPPCGSI